MAAGRTRSTRKLCSWIVDQVIANCVRTCVCACVCEGVCVIERETQRMWRTDAAAVKEFKFSVIKENWL